jgi:hypothetical protein
MITERGTKRLVADWKPGGTTEDRADPPGGTIAAIADFSVEILAGGCTLRAFDFDRRGIVVRASPQTILAAECFGSLRSADDAGVQVLFYGRVEPITGNRRITFDVFRGEMRN